MFINHFLCFTFVVITQHTEARVCHTCLTHCLQICRQVKFTPTVTLTETMHGCYTCDLLKSHYCEMYHTQNNDIQFDILSSIHQTHSLCTRSFVYNCLEHFIMPKSRDCNTLVKFGGQHTIFTPFEMTYLLSSTTVHNNMYTHEATAPLKVHTNYHAHPCFLICTGYTRRFLCLSNNVVLMTFQPQLA
jgi:hypothetical protein